MIEALSSIGDDAMIAGAMNALPLPSSALTDGRIDKAAQDFEAMFATQLLKPMFDTVAVNETFGGGHGEEVMRSFMIQEYGKMIAKTGSLGIAHQVKAEMIKAQEGAASRRGALPVAAQAGYLNSNRKGEQNVSR